MEQETYTVTDVLHMCKTDGDVVCTKTDSNVLRVAINEAVGRGYLYRSQPSVYKLTPDGYRFLDELERDSLTINAPDQNITNPTNNKYQFGTIAVSVRKFFKNSITLFILKYILAPIVATILAAIALKHL